MAIRDNITMGLSQLAKTVENGANTIAKKSSDIVEVSKLNLSISHENSKIENLYKQMGKLVFEKYKYGEIIDKDLEENCRYILQCENAIKEYNEKIENIKGKNPSNEDDFLD